MVEGDVYVEIGAIGWIVDMEFERAMRAKARLTERCAHARYTCMTGSDLLSGHVPGISDSFIGGLERVRTANAMALQGLVFKDRVQRPSKWLLSLNRKLRVLQSPRNKDYTMLPEE